MKLLAVLLALIGLSARAGVPDAATLLQEYVRIDTTNPPGNEQKTAKFLEKIFRQHDVPVEVFDLGKGRANLLATLKGDGTLPAVVLLHHMDVVPADAKFWTHAPFSGEIQDGAVWGRGAIDIKGKGIMDLVALLKLKESGVQLKRDLIYLAVSDEEENSSGTKWMVEHKKDLFSKVQYLIDEGNSVRTDEAGKVTMWSVALGEKSPLWLKINFLGTSGHGSVPHANNAVVKAVKGASRINRFAAAQPLRVIPGTEKFLELNVKGDYHTFPGFKKDFKTSLKHQKFLVAIAEVPELAALMKDTVTLTGLKGSDKVNTIPNDASVSFDCRLLPGTSKDEFLAKIQKAAGPDAKIEVLEYYQAYFTTPKSEFLTALQKTAGDVPVIPTLLVSSTDSSHYRALGLEVFGFEAYPVPLSIIDTAHGNDERLPVAALNQGVENLINLIKNLN